MATAGYVADEQIDVAAWLGASWIGRGVAGTIELLARSLRPGGIILIGEPYWRRLPPSGRRSPQGVLAHSIADFLVLRNCWRPSATSATTSWRWTCNEPDGWDRYEAAKWLTMRRWLEANPGDEINGEVQAQLMNRALRRAHA